MKLRIEELTNINHSNSKGLLLLFDGDCQMLQVFFLYLSPADLDVVVEDQVAAEDVIVFVRLLLLEQLFV